ncbi:MAG: DUF3786 domain-containing protein [Clostridiales bacterium]|nr:DUF3786 domain-containing protein [Clostridiales bacterium]
MDIMYEKDNKERVPFEHYQAEYEKADPQEISVRTGFPYVEEEKAFRVKFLGVEYFAGFPEFIVRPVKESDEYLPLVSMNAAKILVIRFLIEGCMATGTGKFLTYREVPWGETYYRQFNGRCMMRLAYSYGNRLDAFRAAMEKLGAKPIAAGDAGYEVELFDGFPIRFQLWSGDEEFPPSSQILFGDNFAAAFHAEDLVVACDVIIGTMKQL